MPFIEKTLELRDRILSINLSDHENKNELIREFLEFQIDALSQHHKQMVPIIWDAQELYFKSFKSYYSNSICNADQKFIRWTNFIQENLAFNQYFYSDDLIRAINDIYFEKGNSVLSDIVTDVYEGIKKASINSLLHAKSYLYKIDLNYNKKKFARIENVPLQELGLEKLPAPQYNSELDDYIDYSHLFINIKGRYIQESDLLHFNRFNSLHSTLNSLNQVYLTLGNENYNFRNFPFLQELKVIPKVSKQDLDDNNYLLFLYLYARSKNVEYRQSKSVRGKFYRDIEQAESGVQESLFFEVTRAIYSCYNIKRTAVKNHLVKRLFDLPTKYASYDSPPNIDKRIAVLRDIQRNIKLPNKINFEIDKLENKKLNYFPPFT